MRFNGTHRGRYIVRYSTEQGAHVYDNEFDTFEEAVACIKETWEEVEPTYEGWMDSLYILDTAEVDEWGFNKSWYIDEILNPSDESDEINDEEHWYTLQDIIQYA